MPYRKSAPIDALPAWSDPPGGPTLTLRLKTITPMFGGGYEAREPDDQVPVRAAAIRGQLRHWWRATAGAKCGSSAELFQREAEIWGAAAAEKLPGGPGRVSVQVSDVRRGRSATATEVIRKADPKNGPRHGTFLFPFQEQKKQDIPAAGCLIGTEFTLSLRYDSELAEDVESAVIAWVLFGGVGARTRRGCGALQASGWAGLPKSPTEVRAWVGRFQSQPRRDWPTIAVAFLGPAAHDAMAAWEALGRFWSAFRKGHIGEIPYSPMSGGKWKDHARLKALRPNDREIRLVKPFLGLPIVYQQFKNDPRRPFAGTLEPADSGRFASPVVLKPVAIGGSVFPGVIALKSPSPDRIQIADRGQVLDLALPNDEPLLRKTPVETVLLEASRFFGSNRPEGAR